MNYWHIHNTLHNFLLISNDHPHWSCDKAPRVVNGAAHSFARLSLRNKLWDVFVFELCLPLLLLLCLITLLRCQTLFVLCSLSCLLINIFTHQKKKKKKMKGVSHFCLYIDTMNFVGSDGRNWQLSLNRCSGFFS